MNQAYFPGKVYRSTSQDVVFRAMAGNTAITTLKVLAWLKTGSNAMLSEAIHSLVDTGNQAILILGLKQAAGVPDKKHQYGYGRAAYFWSLISALGIFWLGSGVTVVHGIQSILEPPKELLLSWEIWCVLAASFSIDGYVLKRSVQELLATKPKSMSFYQHVKRTKDPFMMAVLLEDLSACVGVIIAGCGIGASHITGNPLWDSLASVSIGVLLGGVAVSLIRLNQKYLLGQSVEPEIENGIRELLLAQDPAGYISNCRVIVNAKPPRYIKISVPVLILAGDEDMSAPLEGCKKMFDEMQHGEKKLEVMKGIGHWHCLEAFDEVAKLIEGFYHEIQ